MPEPTGRTRVRHIPWPVSIELIEHHLVWVNATDQESAIRAVTAEPDAWLRDAGAPIHHVLLVTAPDDNDIETALANPDQE